MKAKISVFLMAILVAVLLAQTSLQAISFAFASEQTATTVTVHYIDVGQGDSIFIDTTDKDVLIDGGPGSAGATVVSYLASQSITRIHLMVATHMHADHIGGLAHVLSSALTVDEILINNQQCDTATCANFMSLAASHTVTIAQRGQAFQLATSVNLAILNPVQPLEFDNQNDNSVVTRLQAGSAGFLFTGDAEQAAEQSMLNAGSNLQASVLKVGHHGSRTATSQAFLDAVEPAYAIISAGEDNTYGHPHEETIQKLLAKGVAIYGTFKSGTIVASTDGTSTTFIGSPEQIPEFHDSIIILTLLMLTPLLAVALHKTRQTKQSRPNTAAIQPPFRLVSATIAHKHPNTSAQRYEHIWLIFGA